MAKNAICDSIKANVSCFSNITIDKLKEMEKPGKLHQEMMGYRKKNKLDLPGLSPEVVGEWIKN